MLLKLSYIGLTAGMLFILFFIGNYAINKSVVDPTIKKKKKSLLFFGLLFWQIFIFATANSGFLADFSFPPRFALVLILPSFAFTGVFLYKHRKKQWLQSIPLVWLTAYQSFRIVIETIFVATVAAGILHKNVTIEGYNFDMVFGFTAPIMAIYVYKSKSLSKSFLKFWNYLGLAVIAVIIFLFISTIYFPEIYGYSENPFPKEFTQYPYALVPGFLMPSAVFIHVLTLFRLSNNTGKYLK